MAANPVTSWLRSPVYYTDIKKQQTTKPDNTQNKHSIRREIMKAFKEIADLMKFYGDHFPDHMYGGK